MEGEASVAENGGSTPSGPEPTQDEMASYATAAAGVASAPNEDGKLVLQST